MIISHCRRFVFIHIHKTGGTSMEVALDPHLAWNDLVLGSTPLGQAINDPYQRRFGLSKHGSLADIARVCGRGVLEDKYVFALVREPAARLCSLYNFVARMIARWSAQHGLELDAIRAQGEALSKDHPTLRWPASRAFIETTDFGGFLRHPRLHQDLAFRSQLSRITGVDGITVDAIPIERAERHLPALAERLGVVVTLPHLNRTERQLVRAAELTEADRALIRDRFAEDYDAFGY
ncbi:hypothetical protein [Falsiroseomonas sp. HW251]|uniref:hypothetical protein n=1 Tax=Falsiroseomonas sp. HW251 TaxID=3390998 RepID=UPI003D31A040